SSAARLDNPGLTVHRPRPPSAPPAKSPPTPPTAPSKYPPVIPVPLLLAADSAPVDWRARSTLRNSAAPARRPPPRLPASAPPVLPPTHAGITPRPRTAPPSHSTPAAVAAPLRSLSPTRSPA